MGTLKLALLAVLVLYGIPVWQLRYKFRAAVYNDRSWKVNVVPRFVKETEALFTNKYFDTPEKKKIGRTYRLYLGLYLVIFILFLLVD